MSRETTKLEILHQKRQEVISLHEEETPIMEIVKKTGLCHQAVKRAIYLYKTGGPRNLKPRERGRSPGSGNLLAKRMEREIVESLFYKKPSQLQIKEYPNQLLWTRELVLKLIQKQSGITLSKRSLSNYLHRWGLLSTPKISEIQNGWCSKKVQDMLNQEEGLLEQFEPENIFWFRKYNIEKKDLTIISVTNKLRKEFWAAFKGKNVTPEDYLRFFRDLVRQSRTKPLLVIKNRINSLNDPSIETWLAQLNQRKKKPIRIQNTIDWFCFRRVRRAKIFQKNLRNFIFLIIENDSHSKKNGETGKSVRY